eukprot:snap_masked-scaffold_11-processed-gene-4.12-mRNA-1 protein AED:0.31 eAED:0.37 QI:0/-1/0/1/-1/1/1/0/299
MPRKKQKLKGQKPFEVEESFEGEYDSEQEKMLKNIYAEGEMSRKKAKKFKKKGLPEESDEDSQISELEDIVETEMAPSRNNTVVLRENHQKFILERKLGNLEFSQILSVTAEKEAAVQDVEDDLQREVSFYKQALDAVIKAKDILMDEFKVSLSNKRKAGYDTRPQDFYAEMVKSDKHMGRIKQNLLFQKQKMDRFETRKKNKEYKKYSKQLQAERLKEKSDVKRRSKELAKEFSSSGSKKPSRKRQAKNQRYGGVGGKGAYKKKRTNTRESTYDDSGFNGAKKQTKKRLGKSRRARAR